MCRLWSLIAVMVVASAPQSAPAQALPGGYHRDAVADSAATSPALTPSSRAERDDAARKSGGFGSALTVFGSLALVIGVFLVAMWLLRRASPNMTAALPAEAFEVLGRAPLANQQHVRLVRCGTRLLLLAVSPSGTDTLAEFTDPAEVDHLVGLCQKARSASRTGLTLRHKERGDA